MGMKLEKRRNQEGGGERYEGSEEGTKRGKKERREAGRQAGRQEKEVRSLVRLMTGTCAKLEQRKGF